MKIKGILAFFLFLLSLFALGVGVWRGEFWTVWNNAKILCLTCIGIK